MGLDIYTYKLKKASRQNITNNDDVITLPDEEDVSCIVPKWVRKFTTTIQNPYYDLDTLGKNKGIDFNNYELISEISYKEMGELIFEHLKTKEIIKINIENIPTLTEDINIVGTIELGNQRGGLNTKFYKDYSEGTINEFVWTKEDLYKYKDLYCLEKTKEEFQYRIIDTFIEGECCVYFSM